MKLVKKNLNVLAGISICFAILLVASLVSRNNTVMEEFALENEVLLESGGCSDYTVVPKHELDGDSRFTTAQWGAMWRGAFTTTSNCGGEILPTFCLDPKYKAPDANANNQYEVERVLESGNPFDRAVLALYRAVAADNQVVVPGFEGEVSDFIINTVTRLLAVKYGENKTSGPLSMSYSKPYECTVDSFSGTSFCGSYGDSGVIQSSVPGVMDAVRSLYDASVAAAGESVAEGEQSEFGKFQISNNDSDGYINRTYSSGVPGNGGPVEVECTGGITCTLSGDSAAFSVAVTGSASNIPKAGATLKISVNTENSSGFDSAMILSPKYSSQSIQRMIVFGAADLVEEFIIKPGNDDFCLYTNFEASNFCGGSGINEMFASELSEHGVLDLKTCLTSDDDIVQDGAGNSLIPQIMEDNRYCTVACGEEWNFTLPGEVNNIRAGTYFMLSAEIEGEKVCVSNKINFSQFKADVIATGNAIATAYGLRESAENYAEGKTQPITCTVQGVELPDGTYIPGFTVSDTARVWENETYSYNSDGSVTFSGAATVFDKQYDSVCNLVSGATPPVYSNNIDSLLRTLDSYYKQINNCSTKFDDYDLQYDPKLSYIYEESFYMERVIGNANYYISEITGSSGTVSPAGASYTTATSVADDYSDVASGLTYEMVDRVNSCGSEREGCTGREQLAYDSIYAKYQANPIKALFKPYTVFWVTHPTGETTGTQLYYGDSYETTDSSKLGRVYPVRLTTKQGEYTYNFAFNNIGEYVGTEYTGDLGRLMNYSGALDPLPDDLKVDVNSSFEHKATSVLETQGKSESYACNYNVVEDICKCCGDDELEINGNAYNTSMGANGHLTFYYKPTSLNQLFQDGFLDANGNVIGEIINWSNDKGQLVYDLIDHKGEDAYIEPEYSYLLTPSVTAAIRSHNNEVSGGFADFNMTCEGEDKYGEYGGYNCSSNFLDDLGTNPDNYGSSDQDIELARPENKVIYSNSIDLDSDLTKIRWVNYSGAALHDSENPTVPTGMGPALK